MARQTHSPRALRVHFVGIGGIGVSALARWFLAENWVVTGSDVVFSQIIDSLEKAGISVKIGHSRANLPKNVLNMVVYSPAIPQDNPELAEARERGITPLSYPEVLGCLTRVYKTIAIAGTHGKSTTTSMAALAFPKKVFDPTVVVGTNLKKFDGTNFKKGKDKWLLIEADEWKASFLNYSPLVTVVTTVDADHLDFYKNLADIKKTFLKFIERTLEGGALVLNREDKNLRSMKLLILRVAKKRYLDVIWYSKKDLPSRDILSVPGEHNLSNAAAVLAIAKAIGLKKSDVVKGLGNYKDSWRRMEYRGRCQVSGVMCQVFDDYAHHPTEIKATLKAFKEKFPKKKLICVYQPHQAKRLKALFKDFVSVFLGADCLVLLPVYEVLGRDPSAPRPGSGQAGSGQVRKDKGYRGYDSSALARAIQKKYPRKEVYYLDSPKKIKNFISKIVQPQTSNLQRNHCVIVMMGAGDIIKYTSLLLV